ncbi:MAG: carbohydrate binding domain-containing protein, partial [Salegentibacter sp.]
MKNIWRSITTAAIVLCGLSMLSAQETELKVDVGNKIAEVQPTMYGIFFEDINFAADGGLYAEKVKNRSFEFELPKMGWIEPNSDRHSFNKESGIAHIIRYSDTTGNHNFARIEVNDDKGYVLLNEGYRGMGIKEGSSYRLSFQAAQRDSKVSAVKFQLVTDDNEVIGETMVLLDSKTWKTYEKELTASKTAEKAKLKITFKGTGEVDLDMVSLFPKDTWKGRKNGLRKDLVQLLADLDPGFLRFPGGCIVEGRTLDKRYQWKKTLGPVEEREVLINRWNTEFAHRLTPDYYQSFGLGYFEYFQLAEDIGAEPLPILGVGIACQFNTGELVPMNELNPYVQDALDLIQFANG